VNYEKKEKGWQPFYETPCIGAWIITGGTQTGVMQFVGEAAREHMLQSGNYEQKLVVIGIAVLGRIANREAIKKGSLSIDKVEEVSET